MSTSPLEHLLVEVELETRQAAVSSQEVESAQAIEMRRSALRVVKAALDSYTQDVTRDVKVHEMEVWKANERIATTAALRKLRVAYMTSTT